MSYSEQCPCCRQEQDFRTKQEWQRERKRWLKRAIEFVNAAQQSVQRTPGTPAVACPFCGEVEYCIHRDH